MAKQARQPLWFKMWAHHKPLFDVIEDAAVGRAVKAALHYFATGEIQPLGQLEMAIFVSLQQNIDEATAKYQLDIENGKKGGRPKQTDGIEEKPTVSEKNPGLFLETQEEVEEEIEVEEEAEVDVEREKATCKQVVALYKQICVSFPSIRSLTEARKKAIKARLNTYTLDDFRKLFEMAEASAFLKGANDRNWTATFDWLIKDTNMAKVLEGNFVDKPGRYTRKETKPNWMQPSGVFGEAELYGIQRAIEAQAENDPAVMAQAEALKKQMQEKYGKAGNGV